MPKYLTIVFWIPILCFTLLWFWMILPSFNRREETVRYLRKGFAHRGLHSDEVPENSLAAFRQAKTAGYGIELDIQLTKDGKVVVLHDANLLRATGINRNVADVTWDEIQNLKIFESTETVPLLSDVLKEMVDVPLLVELKGEVNGKELCPAAAKQLDSYRGPYAIESFNPLIVRWFRKNRPYVLRGQLSSKFSGNELSPALRFVITNLLTNHFSRPNFVAYDIRHRHQISFQLCRFLYHVPIVAWTVHPEDSADCFDGVIFEK